MGAIRDKVTADLDLRGFASTTKTEYLRYAKKFVAYHHRSPTELGSARAAEGRPVRVRLEEGTRPGIPNTSTASARPVLRSSLPRQRSDQRHVSSTGTEANRWSQ